MSNSSLPELFLISFSNSIKSIANGEQIPRCQYIINLIKNIPNINTINRLYVETNVLPIWMAIEALPQIEIIEYLKNVWYSETIRIDDPGCYTKTPWYDMETSTLNVKLGIKDIIQWKYYMIIHDMIPRIKPQHKDYFIGLLDKYATLFGVTYSKDAWESVYG